MKIISDNLVPFISQSSPINHASPDKNPNSSLFSDCMKTAEANPVPDEVSEKDVIKSESTDDTNKDSAQTKNSVTESEIQAELLSSLRLNQDNDPIYKELNAQLGLNSESITLSEESKATTSPDLTFDVSSTEVANDPLQKPLNTASATPQNNVKIDDYKKLSLEQQKIDDANSLQTKSVIDQAQKTQSIVQESKEELTKRLVLPQTQEAKPVSDELTKLSSDKKLDQMLNTDFNEDMLLKSSSDLKNSEVKNPIDTTQIDPSMVKPATIQNKNSDDASLTVKNVSKNLKPKTEEVKKPHQLGEMPLTTASSLSIASDPSSSVTLLSPLKELALSKDSHHLPFINALVEMGSIINSHTSRSMSNNLSSSAAASQKSFAENLKEAQELPEYHMNFATTSLSSRSMANGVYDAKIKIHPKELGEVTAKLKIDKNNAELFIMTENTHVRHIVESNLAQLRENFTKADINVTNIQVESNDSKPTTTDHNKNNNPSEERNLPNDVSDETKISTQTIEMPNKSSDKLVDTYA